MFHVIGFKLHDYGFTQEKNEQSAETQTPRPAKN